MQLDSVGTWLPHVYIAACRVNWALTERHALAESRVRLSNSLQAVPVPDVFVNADLLDERPFVKVGSTYREDPFDRTDAISNPLWPNTTMECLNVPVVVREVLCLIPGPVSLEQALHEHWAEQRVDKAREFFWRTQTIDNVVAEFRQYTEETVDRVTEDKDRREADRAAEREAKVAARLNNPLSRLNRRIPR